MQKLVIKDITKTQTSRLIVNFLFRVPSPVKRILKISQYLKKL